ncbi:TRAP transporter substrate-binding protein [Elioraea rosea]|uniref:TRAP transporter substrate-binding protein n=1 Tax=Elioraea rosea TaxID=2492390 RepID=UPI001182766F|nr:TRAP transporter substrate-binding protein [Elioraea rosea]
MRRILTATCLAVALSSAPPIAQQATAQQASTQGLPPINLKVSGGNRTQNLFRYVYGPFFTQELTQRSNGAITTTFGSIEELGIRGPEVLRLLRLGMFDISEGTLSYMAGEDPHFDALDLPGVTLDIDAQQRATDAYRPVIARQMAQKFGVKLLSMSPVALQVFYCKGRIEGLASLSGKKVRTFNRAMSDLVEAAGGSTVNLPFAEVIPAMQRGVADCAVTGTSAGNTARWWEVTDHLYLLPMGWSMTFFGANLRAWERLDPRTRAFLEAEFAALETRMWAQAKADVEDGIACNTARGQCRDGIVASPPMTPVAVSEDDRSRAQALLRDRVLTDWARRCGAACVREWNSTVGAVVGVEARMP